MRITTVGLFREAPVPSPPENAPCVLMPPELYTVEGSKNYGSEVDVWSFGLFCYSLLTNHAPFDVTEENMELLVAGKWDDTSAHFLELPEKAQNFIKRMLVVDKNARATFAALSAYDEWLDA